MAPAIKIRFRLVLLATGSLGAAAFASCRTEAEARPAVHHARHPVRPSSEASEISALKAQVAALTARLDAQESAQQQTQTAAKDAQASAQTAVVQAQAAQTQVTEQARAVPTEVKTALAAQPKRAPEWYDNTKISGRSYFNISTINQKSDGHAVGRSTAFDIKRFYIGVDHKFNDVFSANLTTDVSLIANTNTVSGTAQSPTGTSPTPFPKTVGETLYIKKAYLQASLNPAFNVRAGSADMPWVPFVEELYGFRYIENTLIDRPGYGTSADWGLHTFGSFAGGHIGWAVSAVDGATYRNPFRSKWIDVEGRLSANYAGFTVGIGGYNGKRAADTFTPYSPANATPTPVQTGVDVHTFHTAQRFNAVGAYVAPKFRLGVEYFYAKNWNRVTQLTPDTSEGVSGFGSFNFYKKFTVFGRYDYIKPTKDLFPNITDDYFNVGVSYSPVKIVDIALVYKRDQVDNGFFSPSNANPSNFAFPIGGVNRGTYDEIGLFGQFRF